MRGDYCWKVTVTQGTVFCYDGRESAFIMKKIQTYFMAGCLLLPYGNNITHRGAVLFYQMRVGLWLSSFVGGAL